MTGKSSDLENQFVSSLPLLERLTSAIARRHALSDEDASDFASWVRDRLIANDYGVFRKFVGRSSLSTYLTAVVGNLFRDYRNARWGRWRPTVGARRLGPVAVRLEELLFRDGHSMREAVQVLNSDFPSVGEKEIRRIAAALSPHYQVRELSLDALPTTTRLLATPPADPIAVDAVAEVELAVNQVIACLPAQDAAILHMRFWTGLTVADVARALRLDQKALYRRLDALQLRLRAALEERGVDQTVAADVLATHERSAPHEPV